VRSRLPGVAEKLAEQVVNAVGKLRKLELKKSPSIAETLDWAQALALLNADTLSGELVAQTLNLVLKHESDVDKAKPHLHTLALP
jgi:MoxR-like ATPase